MNKIIIISLILFASNAHLTCSEILAPIRESLNRQSMLNDVMISLNKAKQDLNKLHVSMEDKPRSKAVKFALRNLMKMLDMLFSQTVKLTKFFISSDTKVDTNIQKSSKRVEAEEDSQSLENGLEAPLLSETLKKQEKEEKKEKQKRKQKELLGLVDKLQNEVNSLEKKLKEKDKDKKIEKSKKKNKNTDSGLVLKYINGVNLEAYEFRNEIGNLIEKDDVKGLKKLLSSSNIKAVRDAVGNGDYCPTLRALMVVCPATQVGGINDDTTRKALFMYEYMNCWIKPAYNGGKEKCLAYFQKKDPFGMNDFFCVKQNVGRWRTYESTIILDLKHQIKYWKDTQEITDLLSKAHS